MKKQKKRDKKVEGEVWEQKKRGRKVEGQVWAVDLAALGRDRAWLRYEDLRELLKETIDIVKQQRKDEWMVKACYSIFHLSPRDEGKKVETAVGRWGTYDEVGEHVKVAHWHIHAIVWADSNMGCRALACRIMRVWGELAEQRGYKVLSGYDPVTGLSYNAAYGQPFYNAGKVVYALWQEIHGDFYASRKSWKWRDMLRKIKGLYGRAPYRAWEVWKANAELAVRQFTGEQILIDMYKGHHGDEDAEKRAAKALEKRHDFPDLMTAKAMKTVVGRMRRNLARRDVMALLKIRKR